MFEYETDRDVTFFTRFSNNKKFQENMIEKLW